MDKNRIAEIRARCDLVSREIADGGTSDDTRTIRETQTRL